MSLFNKKDSAGETPKAQPAQEQAPKATRPIIQSSASLLHRRYTSAPHIR